MPKREMRDIQTHYEEFVCDTLTAQGGKCPICQKDLEKMPRTEWRTDWYPPTTEGVIAKSILCFDCWMLANWIDADDMPSLRRAINYVLDRTPNHRISDRDFREADPVS